MKKFFIYPLYFCLFFTVCTLISCKAKSADLSGKIKIETTIFPFYEWVHELTYVDNNMTDNTILSLTVKSGIDYHSFEPINLDIDRIKKCDLLIYAGGPTDQWIEELLQATPEFMGKTLNLTAVLHENNPDEDYSDEHIWLSLKNAKVCCKAISEAITELNPEYSDLYLTRLNDYLTKLDSLDERFYTSLLPLKGTSIILCDRNPFTYLFKDYNINCVSPSGNCQKVIPFTEEQLNKISDAISQNKSKVVYIIDNSDKKDAKNAIFNSSQKFDDIYTLDSFQATSLRDAFNGKTYIKTMENNLTELLKTLK